MPPEVEEREPREQRGHAERHGPVRLAGDELTGDEPDGGEGDPGCQEQHRKADCVLAPRWAIGCGPVSVCAVRLGPVAPARPSLTSVPSGPGFEMAASGA